VVAQNHLHDLLDVQGSYPPQSVNEQTL
jgi:hypothetical protein